MRIPTHLQIPFLNTIFQKKSEIEQSKIIVDIIIHIIEEEVDTQISMEQLLDELAKQLLHIHNELEAGNCPPNRLNAMGECLEWGAKIIQMHKSANNHETASNIQQIQQ